MTKIREGYKETEIGVIPEDWEVKTIGDCSNKILGGGTPPRNNPKNYNGDIPWITVKDMDGKFYKADAIEYITAEAIKNSATNLIAENSVIVATRMGLGRGFINTKPVAINQDLKAIILKDDIDSKFFLFWYLSKASVIESLGTGTTVKGIRLETLNSLQLPLPKLPEQQRIAEILSTTDAHIEKLDKIIEDYKLLKKGMMKKLLTEGIGHTEFKETEIGRIPKEWEVKPLGEIASICYGKNQKEIEDESGIYKILGTGGVMGKTNSYLWNQPSVLIGRKGTINKPMYIDEPFWTVDTLFYTKINYGYSGKWLYYYLNAIDLAKYNEATGVPSLNSNTLSKIQIAVPTYSQQLEIEYVLSSLDSNINLLNDEKQDFIQLKKSLMEKLLTGKIRVV